MLGLISVGEFITSEGEVYLCARGFSSVGVHLSFWVWFSLCRRGFTFVGVGFPP